MVRRYFQGELTPVFFVTGLSLPLLEKYDFFKVEYTKRFIAIFINLFSSQVGGKIVEEKVENIHILYCRMVVTYAFVSLWDLFR